MSSSRRGRSSGESLVIPERYDMRWEDGAGYVDWVDGWHRRAFRGARNRNYECERAALLQINSMSLSRKTRRTSGIRLSSLHMYTIRPLWMLAGTRMTYAAPASLHLLCMRKGDVLKWYAALIF
jgi:hypothetical protein